MAGAGSFVEGDRGLSQLIQGAIQRVEAWLVAHDYKAFDPFDGLNSSLRPLAAGKRARQVLQQMVRRFPWNLRPLLGVHPATSTKAMGYLARAYLKLYQVSGDEAYGQRTQEALSWLQAHASQGYSGLCWGNHFDYQSRVFYLPAGVPTVVWTAHIGHAFLDALSIAAQPAHLDVIQSICRFITNDLEARAEPPGICISYIPGGYYPVHNANMLAAATLARAYALTGDANLKEIAAQAVAYTVARQHPDGAWWYGEAENLHWVDNWHTAYVLDSLWWTMKCTDDWTYQAAFRRGAAFWVHSFFLPDGTPKYFPDRTYPIDIQSAAQAIETLCLLSEIYDPTCLDMARRVASWTITHMQDPDGHFYYQRGRWWLNRTPMLHWGQATTLYALARLLELTREKDEN